jgi:hypothetical protein
MAAVGAVRRTVRVERRVRFRITQSSEVTFGGVVDIDSISAGQGGLGGIPLRILCQTDVAMSSLTESSVVVT